MPWFADITGGRGSYLELRPALLPAGERLNQICGPDVVVPIEEVGLVVIMLAAIGIIFQRKTLIPLAGQHILAKRFITKRLSNVCFVAGSQDCSTDLRPCNLSIWIVGVLEAGV